MREKWKKNLEFLTDSPCSLWREVLRAFPWSVSRRNGLKRDLAERRALHSTLCDSIQISNQIRTYPAIRNRDAEEFRGIHHFLGEVIYFTTSSKALHLLSPSLAFNILCYRQEKKVYAIARSAYVIFRHFQTVLHLLL